MTLPRTCRRTRRGLPLLLSEDLSAAADRAIRQHLAECPGCQRELRAWLDLRADWRSATGPRRPLPDMAMPGAEFFAALERDVLDRVAEVPVVTRRSLGSARRLASAAAALLVLGVLGVWMAGRGGSAGPADQPLDRLLGGAPILDSRPFQFDPDGPTRPVSEAFVGLRGRQDVDRAVAAFLGERVEQDWPQPR